MTITEQSPDTHISWPAPRWALTTDDTDGFVSHQRPVGYFTALGPNRTGAELEVYLIQTEQLRAAAGIVQVDRDAVEVAVGDERLSVPEARRLAALLTNAVNLVEQ